MFLLVLGASVLIAIVTVFQYKEEAQDYHRDRLLRKEAAIRENINYILKTTTYPVETAQIPLIFKDKIYEIKDIHSLEIFLYDLEGNLLKSSKPSFFKMFAIASNPFIIYPFIKFMSEKPSYHLICHKLHITEVKFFHLITAQFQFV